MARSKTYQVVFESGATVFIEAHSFSVEGDEVAFHDEEGEPLEEHYFRSGAVQAVILAEDGERQPSGFTPRLA